MGSRVRKLFHCWFARILATEFWEYHLNEQQDRVRLDTKVHLFKEAKDVLVFSVYFKSREYDMLKSVILLDIR